MIGAFLEIAPQNWQVTQLGQTMYLEGHCEGGEVYVKLISEITGQNVIPWQKAKRILHRWYIAIEGIPAGMYTLVTCLREGKEDLELARQGDKRFHVGIGDVYVIAGQSNAVGFGREAYEEPPVYGVSVLRNNGCWDMAAHPLGDSTGSFRVNRDNKNPGHSPYLTFGRILRDTLGYPIGLVQTALGGSGMERWNPSEEGALYRNMLESIHACGKIKGVLWYQGCTDVMQGTVHNYDKRFMNLVRTLRNDLDAPDLPFLTCQLNHWENETEENQKNWDLMRKIQQTIAEQNENIYIVPTFPLSTTDGIHNSVVSNKIIGTRLAELALTKIYHNTGRKGKNDDFF